MFIIMLLSFEVGGGQWEFVVVVVFLPPSLSPFSTSASSISAAKVYAFFTVLLLRGTCEKTPASKRSTCNFCQNFRSSICWLIVVRRAGLQRGSSRET